MKTKGNYRYAFYVSGSATRLVNVIKNYPEIIEHTILVVNDEGPNDNLKNLLLERNIEYYEFRYEDVGLKGKERSHYISNRLLEKFNASGIDYAFCFGGRILNGDLLKEYNNRVINFHPSILPIFPGIKSIDQALSSNAFLLGNTAHFIDEGIDTGPIIMQSIMHSSHYSDYEDVLHHQLPMLKQIFEWLNQNRVVVENGKVKVVDALYDGSYFLPKLEI